MYRLLVSKLRRGGHDMYKVTLIDVDDGSRFVLDKPILTLEELSVLEAKLAEQCKLNGKLFLSKNYKPDGN